MELISQSDLRGAAWNSCMSLVYLTTGSVVYMLVRGSLRGNFYRENTKDRTSFLIQALAISAGIATTVAQALWAEKDLVQMTGEKMVQLFSLQVILTVAARHFVKSFSFAVALGCSSLNGYFGSYAASFYGGFGIGLAYNSLLPENIGKSTKS